MRRTVVILILYVLTSSARAQLNDKTIAEIKAMHWVPASGLQLSHSKSKLVNLPDYVAITDQDAARYEAIVGNSVPGLEAHLYGAKNNAEAVVSFTQTGYVTSTDWGEIEPRKFLEEISRNTEASNAGRIARKIVPIHVDGWVQVPTFNYDTHTASWILMNHADDGTRVLNAVALKLGRFGIERITYIDDEANVSTASQNLLLIANAHQFQEDARYERYVAGSDKAAEYGIAGLVAGVMGVKLVQLAAAGGIALALKKFGVVLAFPLIWFWRKVFSRKTNVG